jgi:hypothetical protein
MSIERLTQLIKPPFQPIEPGTEERFIDEQELERGVKFPEDYRKFVVAYGSGVLAHFIRVINPFAPSWYLTMECQASCIEDACKKNPDFKYEIFPPKKGLVPWAVNNDGSWCCWLWKGAVDRWPVLIVGLDGRTSGPFKTTMTGFLVDILTRKTRCELWPADFPNPGGSDLIFEAGEATNTPIEAHANL